VQHVPHEELVDDVDEFVDILYSKVLREWPNRCHRTAECGGLQKFSDRLRQIVVRLAYRRYRSGLDGLNHR
jgi:hypothetical protein